MKNEVQYGYIHWK